MASRKEVVVVINGEEYVSKAARDAEEGLRIFGQKIPSVSAIAAKAAAAFALVAESLRMIGNVVMGSLRTYDEFNATQRKVEGTAKLLGVSQDYLNDIINEGQKRFRLSYNTAAEYGIEVAKLAKNSGNASSATELLAAFLDLGAARGLSASESLKAVQQSIVGVDEGTDKLFGKNPSGLWADFATVIGRSVGTFTDQDKAAALAYATLQNGLLVGGAWTTYLESAAGKQEVVNERMKEAEVAFGGALQPVRLVSMELGTSLMPVLGPLARILGGMLAAAVVTVSKVFNILYGNIGLAVEGLGKLTGNKDMEAWGARAAATANKLGEQLDAAGEAAGRAIRGVDDAAKTSAAEQKVVENVRAEAIAAAGKLVEDAKRREGAAHKSAAKSAKEAADETAQSIQKTREMMEAAIVTTEQVVKRLAPALQEAYDRRPIDNARAATDAVRTATDAHLKATFKGLDPLPGSWEKITWKIAESGEKVVDAARYTLDFAQSFGVLDGEAASALTSVVNIGSAVSKIASSGLSFAGVTGILGGVANIVSTMMAGDAERKRLLAQNNTALDRLRKDIGGLKLNITGEDFTKAQTALGGVVGQLRGGRGAANENDVRNALYAQGLTMADFERIAKEFGIEVRTKSGALNVDSVKAVFEALGTVQLGKVGGDFTSQLDFFKESQDLAGEQGIGRATNLLQFLQSKGKVGALAGLDFTDPVKLREQLLGIRAQLNSTAGIDENQLGSLTGGQFNSLLVDILGLLSPAGTSSGGDMSVPSTGDGTGGGLSAPTETIQAVIRAMDTNIAGVLTTHTTLHERIAVATEGSYSELRDINGKMDTLIAVSGGLDRIDSGLEFERYRKAIGAGYPASF